MCIEKTSKWFTVNLILDYFFIILGYFCRIIQREFVLLQKINQ